MPSAPRFKTRTSSDVARVLSPYWGEHVARYQFAIPHVRGRILDIACGTGYGLPLLQAEAELVVGVDVDWEAAQEANLAAEGGRTRVILADGCRLPFADASFDAVTSFETLEHLEQRSQFLAELRRVLSPQGVCVLSTPNAHFSKPVNGKPHNPFHVFEYTPAELRAELAAHFTVTAMLGQTLDGRFTIPPFWDAQLQLPRTALVQARLRAWRAMYKLPVALRERMSQLFWKRSFFPVETDYHFDPAALETARVLVAVCHPR